MARERSPLQPFLAPAAIAVFAHCLSPDSVAGQLLAGLRRGGFRGTLVAVGPPPATDQHDQHAGEPAEAPPPWHVVGSLAEVRGGVSLALIVLPAAEVPGIIADCARRGVRGAMIYSDGLRAADHAEAALLEQVLQAASGTPLRILGPRAFGLAVPRQGINLIPVPVQIAPGNLALISQSASVCANILDWSHSDQFGLSSVFVPGDCADLGLAEILDHLATDPHTECILLYLEGLRDARGFLSAVRAAASVKPVIALKAGHTPGSALIAEAHSGARCGSDDAFDAALRRAGVLRVRSVGDMFSAARALTTPRMPRGNRLALVANGGGAAVMAADHAAEHDIALASLEERTHEQLRGLGLARWSAGNPVDIQFDAGPERYVAAVTACLADPGVDGVLVLLSPNRACDPAAVAAALIAATEGADKPVLACWLGEVTVRAARSAFAAARFPVFRTPENAIVAFSFMVNWVRNQALLLEMPAALSSYIAADTAAARQVVETALAEGRNRLTLVEAKAVLSAFHIPVSTSRLASSPTEAVAVATQIGYPVALKAMRGPESGSGAVRLHLRSAPEVALIYREVTAKAGAPEVLIEPHIHKPQGRELSIAIRPDRVFGPVIALSEGGIAAEIYDARSLGLPPLNPRLVSEMIGVPHVARLLGPLRRMPAVAQAPIREILLRLSELASELPWVRSLNIASLVADAEGAVVVNVGITLQPLPAGAGRYEHMAICPYPAQMESRFSLRDGRPCTLRPIRPEDASLLQDFVRSLSVQSKRYRYFSALSELPRHSLARHTQIDYGRQLTLVATLDGAEGPRIVGEAQYTTLLDGVSADFAVVIADQLAGQGLGMRLMKGLCAAAQAQGLRRIRGDVLAENEPMLGLMEAMGFVVNLTDDPETVEVTLHLS